MTPLAPAANPAMPAKKFRLASELSKTISPSDIADKIMDSEVQLTIREILAVSKDVARDLHERTKLRRTPVNVSTESHATGYTDYESSAAVNSVAAFYALPSGRAKVLINDEFLVSATLDSGSKVNVMPRRIFEKMGLPIDRSISWRINSYNSNSDEPSGMLGVCHDVLINIGGVAIKQHIFVVEHSNADLLLGRPWE